MVVEGLSSVIIPDSVKSIGDYTFWDCNMLGYVKIPDSVTSIGEYAFSGCKNLYSITIPDSVTSISDSAFSSCINLRTVRYKGTKEDWDKIKGLSGSGLFGKTITSTVSGAEWVYGR